MENKKVIEVDKYERGIIINALNEFRNGLIKEGTSVEAVDELLLKVIDAPNKKKNLILSKGKENYHREAR